MLPSSFLLMGLSINRWEVVVVNRSDNCSTSNISLFVEQERKYLHLVNSVQSSIGQVSVENSFAFTCQRFRSVSLCFFEYFSIFPCAACISGRVIPEWLRLKDDNFSLLEEGFDSFSGKETETFVFRKFWTAVAEWLLFSCEITFLRTSFPTAAVWPLSLISPHQLHFEQVNSSRFSSITISATALRSLISCSRPGVLYGDKKRLQRSFRRSFLQRHLWT